jgi:hypothetical protein
MGKIKQHIINKNGKWLKSYCIDKILKHLPDEIYEGSSKERLNEINIEKLMKYF